jgi:hypothetical protein
MGRFRGAFTAIVLIGSVLVLQVAAGGWVATAAPFAGGSITSVCAGRLSGPNNDTFTLTQDCGPTTATVTIPPNVTTVDGGGFTLSATDPIDGRLVGAVLTNATAGQTMAINNLSVSAAFSMSSDMFGTPHWHWLR